MPSDERVSSGRGTNYQFIFDRIVNKKRGVGGHESRVTVGHRFDRRGNALGGAT
jgi:hypothetical protein